MLRPFVESGNKVSSVQRSHDPGYLEELTYQFLLVPTFILTSSS